MAWLMATAMATRPFWSEYRILAWEPTTCRGENEKVAQPKCIQGLGMGEMRVISKPAGPSRETSEDQRCMATLKYRPWGTSLIKPTR